MKILNIDETGIELYQIKKGIFRSKKIPLKEGCSIKDLQDEVLDTLDDLHIVRYITNTPLLEEEEYENLSYFEILELTYKKGKEQIVRDKNGKIVLDDNNKPQYEKFFFSIDKNHQDVDCRTKEEEDFFLSEELLKEIKRDYYE